MGESITVIVDGETISGQLNGTETAEAIAEVLPLEDTPHFWGEEIYFAVPVDIAENERPKEELEVGDLAYWPDGNSFCIFYGPTPSSEGSEPRPASPVTVIGELTGNVSSLRELDPLSAQEVRVEKG